ncbi:unnamed protein product [Cunninghamella blakesleeana]
MTQQRKFRCIDLSDFDKRKEAIVNDIMTASKENGFFYVSNHGINSNDVQEMFNTGKQFFALPDNIKSKYPLDVPRNAGWEKLSQIRPQTGLPDLKESMQLTFHHIPDLWPSEEDVPDFKPKVEKFMKQCNDLSQKILECLAIGLDFPHDYFTRCHDITQPDALNSLRFQHYFDLKEKLNDFGHDHYRTGPHTDPDTITLLFHPKKNHHHHHHGLEACQGREDVTTFVQGSHWLPISPNEDEIICNIGDMMMRWSDDVLKSNFYRVNRPTLDDDLSSQYNITYFVQANKSAIIQGRTKYNHPLTAGDFLRQAMERNHQRVKKLIDQRNAESYRKQQGQLNHNNKRGHSRTSSFSEQQPKRRTIIAPVLAI